MRTITVMTIATVLASPALAEDELEYDGYQQLLPRNGIPAIVDPTFVTVEEADIPAEAWVLGFAHGDEAWAYDLNLLNHHEVVNQTTQDGKLPIAAVW